MHFVQFIEQAVYCIGNSSTAAAALRVLFYGERGVVELSLRGDEEVEQMKTKVDKQMLRVGDF